MHLRVKEEETGCLFFFGTGGDLAVLEVMLEMVLKDGVEDRVVGFTGGEVLWCF